MRKTTYILVLVLLLSILALGGCGQSAEKEAAEPHVVAVETAPVELDFVEITDRITGKISPQAEVNIVPKMGGKVDQVAVKVGQRVKSGDLLVRLDTAEISAQVKQAEAALAAVKGNIAVLEANFSAAKDNLDRMKYLFEQGGISQQQYNGAKTQFEVAQAQLNNAKDGGVQQAQAALDLARTQLTNAVITAPQGGIVASVNVEPGEMAGPTMPVVTVVDIDTVVGEFSLTEGQVGLVKNGLEIDVLVKSAGAKPMQGKVGEISPVADPRTKAFTIKVVLANKEHIIKPGMTAEIDLTLDKSEKALVMPVEAIVEQDDKTSVYVVRGEVVSLEEVAVILENDAKAAVTGNLEAGIQVVVVGKEQLQDGAKVKVVSRREE